MLTGSKIAEFDDHVGRARPDLGGRAAHHPADADRPLGVGDDDRLGMQLAIHVVQRLEALAGPCATHDDPAAVDGGGIEGMDRLPELDHHVVAGVDDVRDRPLAGREQAHLDVVRRRADRDSRHPATDEARAQVRILDLDRETVADRRTRLDDVRGREAERRAGQHGDLARQPDDRERVAAVRLDVDVEHGVAVQRGQFGPERRARRQDQDPVGVDGQPQLVAGAQHPVADDAHLLGALDPTVAGQHRAGERDRDPLAGGDVRRPAHDLERLPCPDGHGREREPIGARVLLDRQQLADDDVAPVGTPRIDALDLHPEHRQALGEDLRGQVDVHVLAQPAERHPHRNCSRKRRSFSMYRRRSPTLWRRLEIRSTPIPNAKPW